MYLIYLSMTVGLILINLAGLNAWVSRYLPAQASARVLGLLLIIFGFFAIEHVQGFGKLYWLWPLTTALAVWVLCQRRDRQFWMGEWVFALGFGYGIAWRFAYPNIDAGSEHLTDLYLINNFVDGVTLPAQDYWLAGEKFTCYYAFQHYAAALLVRLFNCEIGLGMNLAWALIIALLVTLGWEISGYFVKRLAFRGLLLAALMLGGNGLSPLMPWMIQDISENNVNKADNAITRVWATTRFAGMYAGRVNTSLGVAVAKDVKSPESLEFPMETIAYYSVLGDYHPPLSGFVLALWTLALSAFLGMRKVVLKDEIKQENYKVSAEAVVFFALGLTPALTVVSNTWVFPLQCLLLANWLVLRQWKADIHWLALLIGIGLGFALSYPFLSYFAFDSADTPIRWVTGQDHVSLRLLLALHWPLMIWLGIGIWLARQSVWAGWLSITLLIIFCASELIYVDDSLSGKYQRFITILKWWSWLWPTALIGLGSVALGQGGKTVKTFMVLSLSSLLVYTLDIASYWRYVTKPQLGQMAGNGWLKQDQTQSEILAYLKNAPEGVVMESIQGSYSPSTALALFAHKPALLGWPDHLSQWHGNHVYISNRAADIQAFYLGNLPEPLGFLGKFPVQTIVWSSADQQRAPTVREKLQAQIGREYQWRAFDQNAAQGVGIWERR